MGERGQASRLVDVASRAGVSRTTAAKVLLGTGGNHVRVSFSTRSRVLSAARELDYRPNRAAQALRGAKTEIFGVLMDTVNTPVMNDRLAAVEKAAYGSGYRLLVGQIHGDSEILRDYLSDFDSRGVDAILCLFDLTDAHLSRAKQLLSGRRNIVYHGRAPKPEDYCIRVDTSSAVVMLVNHLAIQGKQRTGLALWSSVDELMDVRRRAFVRCMSTEDTATTQRRIWVAQSDSPEPSREVISAGIEYLVQRCGVDAIIASNDTWGVHFIQQLRLNGIRVPEEVAVTGYDNTDITTVIEPSLTSIDQNHVEYAAAAIKLLKSAVGGNESEIESKVASIKPHLVVRESSRLRKITDPGILPSVPNPGVDT